MKLTLSQENVLGRVQRAQEAARAEYVAADAEARVRKARAKAGVSAVIQEALAAGVPKRQVATRGLGYATVVSLEQYLSPEATVGAIDTVQRAASPFTFTRNDTSDNEGREYFEIHVTGTDGTNMVMEGWEGKLGKWVGIDVIELAQFQNRDDVISAFRNAHPEIVIRQNQKAVEFND